MARNGQEWPGMARIAGVKGRNKMRPKESKRTDSTDNGVEIKYTQLFYLLGLATWYGPLFIHSSLLEAKFTESNQLALGCTWHVFSLHVVGKVCRTATTNR